jgi:hypothetical protein
MDPEFVFFFFKIQGQLEAWVLIDYLCFLCGINCFKIMHKFVIILCIILLIGICVETKSMLINDCEFFKH